MGVDINIYRQRIGLHRRRGYVCGKIIKCVYKSDPLDLFLYLFFQRASDSSWVLARLGVVLLIICMHLFMYMMSFALYTSIHEPSGYYSHNTRPFPYQ